MLTLLEIVRLERAAEELLQRALAHLATAARTGRPVRAGVGALTDARRMMGQARAGRRALARAAAKAARRGVAP